MKRIIIASGYFNPPHIGHINLFREAKNLGDYLVVIVNNDEQVKIKGSIPFMRESERVEMVKAIRYVDETFLSIDKDGSVSESLKAVALSHNGELFFANGGDRHAGNIPEEKICYEFNIKMIDNVGGRKVQSSSFLLKNIKNTDFIGKKVLITGGGGFIGTHIVINLAQKGFQMRLFDLNFNNFDILCQKLGYCPQAEKIIGNVLDKDRLAEAVKGCDYVVHAAAMLGVKNTELKKIECLNVNIVGTINVLEACIRENVKRIVFTSSSEVYGEPVECPIKETDPKSPVSLYGTSKLAGEEYIKAYSAKYGLEFSIVRFFNVYGPGQVAEFVMPRFIKNILNNESPVVYGTGSQIRTFCFVEDAVEGVSKVLIEGNGKNQTFNIGNDEGSISIKELAEKIIKISGKDLKPSFVDMEDSDREVSREIQRRIPTIYQARQMLNYQPKFSLDQGIRKVIEVGCIFNTWLNN